MTALVPNLTKIITRRTILLSISLFVLLLAIVQVIWTAYQADGFYDLPAFTGASQEMLSGNSPYAHEYSNRIGLVRFQYPPAATLWLAPLIILGWDTTHTVFTIVSLGGFILALWFTFALHDNNQLAWEKVLIIALLIQTFPLKMTIMLGQVNTLVLLLLTCSLLLLKRERLFRSALLLSGAISIKIIPIVFMVVAFGRRQVIWASFVFFCLLAVNALFIQDSVFYVQNVLPSLLTGSIAANDIFNQSLQALLYRLHLIPFASAATGIVALILILLLLRKTKQLPICLQMISLLPVLVLIAANSWQHHLILMYPFIIIFVHKWRWFLPLWVLLALRPSYVLLFQPTPSWLWSYQTLGILVLIFWLLKSRAIASIEKSYLN